MDVVWISAVLEHVPEFEKVLAEAARIGRKFILLHRLFIHDGPTEKQILTTAANEYPYEDFHIRARFARCGVRFGRAECRADHRQAALDV